MSQRATVTTTAPLLRQTAVVSVDELFGNLAGALGDTMRNTNRRGLSLAAGWLRDQERRAWRRLRVRKASRDTWRYADEGKEEDTGALNHVFNGGWERRKVLRGKDGRFNKLGLRRLRRKRQYSIREDAAKSLQVKNTSVRVGEDTRFVGSRRGKGTLNTTIAMWNKSSSDGKKSGWVDAGVTFMRYGGGAQNLAHLLEAGHTVMHPSGKRIGFTSGKWPVKKTFERGTPTMVRMWTGYMLKSVKELQRGNAQWFKHGDLTGKEGRRRLRSLTMKLGKG